MFVDVHAHLNHEKFEDVKAVIERAQNVGVEKIISASYDILSTQRNIEIADSFSNVFITAGIHPENIDENVDFGMLKKLCKHKKIVAIGEIGLDYHFTAENKEKQKEVFIRQIDLANELSLPIVVHCRDAMGDALEILQKHKVKLPSLMHCYSGSAESAVELMKLGFSFSFGGVITFKNAKRAAEVVGELPLSCIMLETDCPYLSPEPFRGQVNEPKNVVLVAQKIAELKNLEISKIEEKTTKNAEKMFKI